MEQLDAERTAKRILAAIQPRWTHVQGVAAAADRIVSATPEMGSAVVEAAWLHDVGYAPPLIESGFHPLDGALFLTAQGFPVEVVSLVAFHTGAEFEADERGLMDAL